MLHIRRFTGCLSLGRSFLLFVLAVFLVVVSANLLSKHTLAATNGTMNFQARLMTGTGAIAADGDYNIEFKIYDTASTGATAQGVCTGNCKWVETRTSTNKVHVANGYVAVNLGSVTAFGSSIDWDQDLWITMNVGGTGSPSWDGEMSPRLKLTAVPYAFRAGQLARLGTNTGVLQLNSTFGQNTVITLPDPSASTATVCYQNSASCGFATGSSGSYIQNQYAAPQTANFDIQSASSGQIAARVRAAVGQTADIFQVYGQAGPLFQVSGNTNFATFTDNVIINGQGSSSDIPLVVKANSNQSGSDLVADFRRTNGDTVARFSYDGALYLGNQGSNIPGSIGISAGSGGYGFIDSSGVSGAPKTIHIPNETGTICVQSSTNCGFQAAGNYANTALSNLASVAINTSLLSGSSTIDLGSAANPFRDLYLGGTATNNFRFTGTAGAARTITLQDLSGTLALVQTAGSSSAQTGDMNVSGTLIAGTALQGTLVKSANNGAGGTSGITLSSGNATTSGNTGDVTIASGAATSGNSGSILIDSGTASGTKGSITLGSTNAGTISIGNAAITKTINIGSSGSTAGNSTVNIATSSSNTQAVTIGSNGVAGNTIDIDGGTAAAAIEIGNTSTAHGIQIGTNSSGDNDIIMGSTNAGSTVLIQAGSNATAAVSIQAASSGVIAIGNTNSNPITLGGTSGTTTLQGSVKVSTLGATTATALAVCRDSSTTQLIDCDSGSGGKPFVQGGNSFGATAVLGTNDTNNLQFETNNIVRATFDQTNNLYLGLGLTNASPTAFSILTTGSTTAGTDGATLSITGGAGASATTGSSGGPVNITGGASGGTGNNQGGGTTVKGGTGTGTAAGGTATLQGGTGGTGAAATGGAVQIQGGTGNGSSSSNGGTITLQGGTAGTGGVKGLVKVDGGLVVASTTFSSGSSTGLTGIDTNSVILATASNGGLTFTVPSPTITTSGRVLYVTNVGVNAFTLSFASTAFTLNPGSTATLVWNNINSAWTSAGVDASTLQNVYSNSIGGTTPEILVDANRNGVDIQDNGLSANTVLFAVRGTASASTLGTGLFTVDNTGKVVQRLTTDATAAFQIQSNSTAAILDVDTTNQRVGINTSAPGAGNNLQVNQGLLAPGTVTNSAASPNVTGTSTTFTTTFRPGDIMSITTPSQSCTILSITDDTHLVCSANLSSASTNSAYTINSTARLVVQNNGNVGIGTSAPSRPLHVSVNNSLANAPTLLVEQSGSSGDSSLEFKTPAKSWIIGSDASNTSTLTINSSTAANSTTLGNLNGNTTDSSDQNAYECSQFTAPQNGTAVSISIKLANAAAASPNNNYSLAIYNGTGSAPTTLLASAGVGTLGAVGFNTLPITATLVSGSVYWLCANNNSNSGSASNWGYDTAANGQGWFWSSQTFGSGWASSISGGAASTQRFGIYVTYTPAGSYDSFGSALFTMNDTGQTTFRNFINSGSGFQVQNASSSPVFDVDTSNGRVGINTSAPTADLSFGVGARTINVLAQTATNTAGSALTVTAAGGNGTGAGGLLTLQGGASGTSAGAAGGGVAITGAAGTSTGTGGAGGSVTITAGAAGGSGNNAGGGVTARLGAATGTGTQGTFQVQNALGASLLTVDSSNTAASLNLSSNPGAETGSPPTGWSAQNGGTITADTTNVASGSQSTNISMGTTQNRGVRVTFATAPTPSTTINYIVSFSVKQTAGTAIAPGNSALQVVYSPDNGTTLTATCSNYSTSSSISTTLWTKVSCTFIPGSTSVTTALLIIRQADTPGSGRTIVVDNLSVVQQNSSGTQNVGDLKVGGAVSQGLTLFTLDTYAANPFTGSNAGLAGSMYFDTTQNKIQCYDGSTWGACGAAPDNIITLTPEYSGAVLNGSGIGTMTSDFCSNEAGVLSVGSLCGTHDARNFYKWTSPQSTLQEYDVYVTYKLPTTFKNFASDNTITLTARSDAAVAASGLVTYEVYKSTGSAISACGTETTVTTSDNTWQTVSINGNENSTCAFAAGNNVIFKIRVKAKSNANVYVENLNFTFSNQ